MERYDWTVEIYKLDRRYKDGQRIERVLSFNNETKDWAERTVKALQDGYYNPSQYCIRWFNKFTTVKSLMTGKDVEIRTEDRGTVCDPSQERFWSM